MKLPKVLTYDESQGSNPAFGQKPTNASCLWGAHAGILTNRDSTNPSPSYGDILVQNVTSGLPAHPILRYNLRVEMWFKDA